MGKIIVTPQAKKDFDRLQIREQKKIRKRLKLLECDVLAGKKLSGKLKNIYSLRAWPYRIFYIIQKDKAWITHIEHRQGAYKNS